MNFKTSPAALPEVLLVEFGRIQDERGFFAETYKEKDFAALGLPRFVQDNASRSAQGILRGLHYQLNPAAQGKLVRCTRGRVFDAAVDIRKDSPRWGKWAAVELSEDKPLMIYVPPGFAHGFLALTDGAEVLYKTTAYYSPEHERCLLWNDPAVGVPWPIREPALSPRDARAPLLKDAETNFEFAFPL
ncbi:MAG: dTDP-4-dehydrorhamnose 3,5-epimerase [Elusimicrobia bacterium]|nr:dTDP-4-dehydrorhamnose 3,5-epimerase [Elusimicrobiota bacterium]